MRPFSDEILVVDSFSTDRTAEICQQMGVRFVQNRFEGYAPQKRFATQQATYDHIFSVDADEAPDATLQAAILRAKQQWTHEGYTLNRLTNYCGKWVRHGGWYPDKKLRLWHRKAGGWKGTNLHEAVEMQPGVAVAHLPGNLLHYSFPSIAHHLKTVNTYSQIGAEEAFQKGKRGGLFRVLFSPLFKFVKQYIVQRGFLDGYYGLVIAFISAFATFIKYVKLEELHRNAQR